MGESENHPTLIITGASRGLGAAAARIAASLGAQVVLAARSEDALGREAQKIHDSGGSALTVRADVSREEDCRALIRQTLERYGQIHGLVNNSGAIEPIGPIASTPPADWLQNWAVNLLGPVMLTQLALPHLRATGGRVINITSGAAEAIIPGWGAYSTAKAAINHFTKILAREEPAVTALALRPGIVDTEMQAVIRQKGQNQMGETNYNFLYNAHKQGRLLPPEAPGLAMAVLALYAPREWSGETVQWDEPRVKDLVERYKPGD